MGRELCAVPQPWGCCLSLSFILLGVSRSAARAQDCTGRGFRESDSGLCFCYLASTAGFPRGGWVLRQCFLDLTSPKKIPLRGDVILRKWL